MEDIRHAKQLRDYRPIGRRKPGESLKILLDGYNCENETGHLLDKLHDQRKNKKEQCGKSRGLTTKFLSVVRDLGCCSDVIPPSYAQAYPLTLFSHIYK
jgi:hypothetical protein